MKTGKISTLFLVTILALAGIGVSYASWFDEVIVTGEIHTGGMNLEVEDYSYTYVYKETPGHGITVYNLRNPLPGPDDDPIDPDWTLIASSYCYEIEDDTFGFVFDNLFPCIDFEANILFHYTGIPARVIDVEWIWQDILIDTDGDEVPDTPLAIYLDSVGAMDWGLYWSDENGNIIPPGLIGPIDQIEECNYVLFWVWIHLPQEDFLMDLDMAGSMKLKLRQWNQCNGETVLKDPITIPDEAYCKFTHPGSVGPSYFDVKLTNLVPAPPPDYSPPIAENAVCVGWCVDQGNYISNGPALFNNTLLYDGVNQPAKWPGNGNGLDPNRGVDMAWPCINYIINNYRNPDGTYKAGYTVNFVQNAIWYFVDGVNTPNALAQEAIDNVITPFPIGWYESWIPEEGDMIAVLLDRGPCVQHTFIEVDP